jgi:hypothetical protein
MSLCSSSIPVYLNMLTDVYPIVGGEVAQAPRKVQAPQTLVFSSVQLRKYGL